MSWRQQTLFQTTYTVSQITAHIKELLETDFTLQDLWIEGEVSNASQSTAGHLYFSLKDEGARISCVMWRSRAQKLSRPPQDGEQVEAHGRVSVYEPRGAYQFYVDTLQPSGLGLLYQQVEALKQKLAAEGLFDEELKRAIPPFPRVIGLVTSPTGAALRDVCNVLRRRYPLAKLLLSPTLVQGKKAAEEIVRALEALNAREEVDLVIVTRGGGSLEELMPFNNERVARAIRGSRVPVISGVGHETDFTIADFAADVRAPTPSAAAEMAVPDQVELQATIAARRDQTARLTEDGLDRAQRALEAQTQRLEHASPRSQINSARQRVDELLSRSQTTLRHRMELRRERLKGLQSRIGSLNPLATLDRGYALVRHRRTGEIVGQVGQVHTGDKLGVRVSDGEFGVMVE
ncbi:MAG: exodeoxyribonuclease VII large subunit [Chloroflexota bacterium]|nr:exodeoxyribonuclease VII large subunit [Chloroflexota bacterium]